MVLNNTMHVRFDGRSFDLPLSDLDVGTGSSDQEVKRQLATYLNIRVQQLQDYAIDRHQTGNVTVRPEAIFG